MMVLVCHLLPNGLEVVREGLYLHGRERNDRIVGRENEQRRDVLDVLDESVVEIGGEHDTHTLEVGRGHVVVDDVPFRDE